ncbi:uncharacterized protein FIESC28_05854 [Fusarium coffeatum]|uniref:2EXR domain-containing protein n=1 Tax=Fusarium coffeatum TaxID=231269 RepID=A0A366RQ56_9HYPO|nr:uncharacterized protein FIESC28_05854 [Fusarium coffeatum]RBR18932.1 hypothetical protein FIESC28_05854 [Fusarium coffeatum]
MTDPITPQKDEDPPPVTASPTTFDYFSKLPTELRLKIWEYTYPEFQIHYIIPGPDERHPCGRPEGCQVINFPNIASPPLPAALLVNRDSRSLALGQFKSFPRFPSEAFAPEEMPHGYFNPRTDYLHIPNKMRNGNWNFANAPFPQLIFCISKQDAAYPVPGPRSLYPEAKEQGTGIIKLSQQRLSLGLWTPLSPTITLVIVNRSEKTGRRCYHIWPAGEPPRIIKNDVIEAFNSEGERRSKGPALTWAKELREAIMDELGEEEDNDRFIPRVHFGRMRLFCKCPNAKREIGDNGGWGPI